MRKLKISYIRAMETLVVNTGTGTCACSNPN